MLPPILEGCEPFAERPLVGLHVGELHEEHLAHLSDTIRELAAGTIDREAARERLAGLQ